jgi:transposase
MVEFQWFVGIDWATEVHQVAIVDTSGTLVHEAKVKHDGEEVSKFVEFLGGKAATVAVGIETTSGAIVDALIERGIAVFSLNPKQLDRFRDRHSIAGAKDDRRDAFVLAASLRTDLHLYRRVELGSAQLVQLREVSRARDEITRDVVALGNRFRDLVHRYYPQILELGSVHQDAWLLDLFHLAPTPESAARLKPTKVEALLRRYHVRRVHADSLLATLRKKPLPVAPGVIVAASEHAQMVLARFRLALAQRNACDRRLAELLKSVGDNTPADAPREGEPDSPCSERKPHRDAEIILSLPGAENVISATMLTEATTALAHRDYHALRASCGVAPVTRQTGKQRQTGRHKPDVGMRRACHPRLRNCVHSWAGLAIQFDEWARAQYVRLRASGHGHSRALRGVGDRLLAMLVAMLRARTLYDPTRRGSPESPRLKRLTKARRRAEETSPAAL